MTPGFPAPPVLRDAPSLPDALLSRVHGAAAALRERGARPGSRVAIGPSATPEDATAWLLGADVLGAAALVVAPSWTDRERGAVLTDAAPDVMADGAPPASTTAVRPHPGDDVLFYLATTSGSGGRPKVLARTRRSWRIGFDALGPLPGPVLLPGPPASSLFLFGALHGLHHGVDVRWAPTLPATDLSGIGTVHLVPAMLSGLLSSPAPAAGPRVIVSGGASVGPALREQCARLLPGTGLVEYYGAAECSLMALRRGDGPLRPLPGVDVRVRDGELEIRTAQAFSGYLRGGRLEPAGVGFLRLGDRGALTASGDLVVHGRAGTTVSQGGTLVDAEEVEDVLRGVQGVSDVVVAGTPHARLDNLVTAVVEAPHGAPPLRSLRAAARHGLAAGKRPRRWLVTGALPRLASGKVARAAITASLAEGTLDATPFPTGDVHPDAPTSGVADAGAADAGAAGVADAAATGVAGAAATRATPVIDGLVRNEAANGPEPHPTGDYERAGVRPPVIGGSVPTGAAGGPEPRPTGDHGRGPEPAPPVISSSVPTGATDGPDPRPTGDHGRAGRLPSVIDSSAPVEAAAGPDPHPPDDHGWGPAPTPSVIGGSVPIGAAGDLESRPTTDHGRAGG